MAWNRRPGALPVELQLEIIDTIGEEAAFLSEDKFELDPDGFETLYNVSFFCKEWHSMALRHIFRRMRLTTHWRKTMTYKRNDERGRLACLLPLLQHNSSIGDCVKTVYLELPVDDDDEHALLEEVSKHITPVTSLTINFECLIPHMHRNWSLRCYPHLLNAFHNLTRTAELRELRLQSEFLHTSFLEGIEDLETLALSDSFSGLVVDHHLPSNLPRPRKLIMGDNPKMPKSEVRNSPEIRDFFSNVEQLTTLGVGIAEPYRWGEVLNVGKLASLSLHCYTSRYTGGWGDELFSFFRNHIPWECFTQLNSLSLSISASYAPRLGADDPNDVSDLIFTGPSRLPRLSSLQINFCLDENLVHDRRDIPRFIHMLYQRSLDRIFKDHSSFPALKTFRTEIHIVNLIWECIKLTSLIRLVKKELPSVFGPGGRGEVHGWKAVVRAKVEQFFYENDLPDHYELWSNSDAGIDDQDELQDRYDERLARWLTAETDSLTDTGSLDLNSESSDSEEW